MGKYSDMPLEKTFEDAASTVKSATLLNQYPIKYEKLMIFLSRIWGLI
jgi:hypothetical protein